MVRLGRFGGKGISIQEHEEEGVLKEKGIFSIREVRPSVAGE